MLHYFKYKGIKQLISLVSHNMPLHTLWYLVFQMNEGNILKATPAEKDWAAELMAHSQPWIRLGVSIQQCRDACYDPGNTLYVAHNGDKAAGFIILQPRGVAGSPYIKSICINEKFRSQRIGENLIHFAEELYRPLSKHLFLCVSSFNTRAQEFYRRLGYAQAGEFKDYILDGESEILFHKRLR